MFTFRIHITGIVQGVGYRPFVYNQALQKKLLGTVCNSTSGVEIYFNAHKQQADVVYDFFKNNIPPKAKVFTITLAQIENRHFENFSISTSLTDGNLGFISPDFATCTECLKEMMDTANRRYLYPFITCAECGPRYSIIHQLPFDRANTTMNVFTMCDECKAEYENVCDRRYHSQTNSCKDCGVQITVKDNQGILQDEDIRTVSQKLANGKIIAVKGNGGFLLLCDATNMAAIAELRKRKHRPSKPFAVLFKNEAMLQEHCILDNKELTEIKNETSPIVLLPTLTNCDLPLQVIAPGLNSIGAMLPNTGLIYQLAHFHNKPLIATSGNISGSPIIYKNEDAEKLLSEVYDFIIFHDRDVLIPQDDSVLKFSEKHQHKILLRRGRGLAPVYWTKNNTIEKNEIIACGAQLKSSISISKQNMIYHSQFLGDLSSYESIAMYKQTIQHFHNLLKLQPNQLVADLHPLMNHHEVIEQVFNINETIAVQHHKAHFYSCIMDNDALENDEKILGIIWDGVGYGTDKNIWGGEFFEYHNKQVHRISHLAYFPYLSGDKMSVFPKLSALALSNYAGVNDSVVLKNKFSETEWNFYQKLLQKNNYSLTSSMGRLFDGVASLLNICDENEYEGQTAMLLEQAASKWFQTNNTSGIDKPYFVRYENGIINFKTLIKELLVDIETGKEIGFMAAKFHYSLIQSVAQIAQQYKYIAFSGGVFQNAVLVDLAISLFEKTHTLYFHKQTSPNDENISLGQMAYCSTIKNKKLCA